jgi:hypothetical protein
MEILFAIIALSGATFAAGWYWREPVRRARRALERTKNTPIAHLRQDELVKITGVIAPHDAILTSPLENQPCIGYTTRIDTVWDEDRGGRDSVLKSAGSASFLVTDETGTAVVAAPVFIVPPRDWTSQLAPAWMYQRGQPDDPPPLRSTAGEMTTYREVLLRPGDRVSVLGRATLEVDPAGRASLRAPPMLHWIRGSEARPVIVAHAPLRSQQTRAASDS